jgi:hypothetical protein
MTLHVLKLPSLADDLEEVVPPRDRSPMPIHLPAQEVIDRHLKGNPNPTGNVVPWRARRK